MLTAVLTTSHVRRHRGAAAGCPACQTCSAVGTPGPAANPTGTPGPCLTTYPAPGALTGPPAPQASGAAGPVPACPVQEAGEGPAPPAPPPGIGPVVTVCAHPRSSGGCAACAPPSCPPDAEESAIRHPPPLAYRTRGRRGDPDQTRAVAAPPAHRFAGESQS